MRSGSLVVRPMSSLGTASWRRSETRRASLPAASARSSHGRRSRSASLLAIVSSRGSGAARSASSAARLAGAEKIASCSRRPHPASSASIFVCPNHGAAVGQLHVFLEIPAQLLVVGVAQEGGEGLLDADRCAVAVGQRDALAAFCCGCEEQANFVQGARRRHALVQSSKKAAGGGAGSGQELARTTASSSADSWRMARAP
jgi:hypothetical protein